jgi:hypothetical protein
MADRQPAHSLHPLKAVILAAGAKSITEDGLPVLLQELGGKKIMDYITADTAQIISCSACMIPKLQWRASCSCS